MEFRNHTLENGLQIVAECNPEAHSMAVAYCVNTGSRDESADVAGVSHFLEHMLFKGTQTRSADEVNSRFDELGAEYNAWTGKENTTYFAVALPEYQDEIVELWSDLMRPALREKDFETEKQVIIEEIRMYEDQPPFGADEKCELAYYGGHRLANRILGTIESVTDLSVDAMRDYFQARYSPANIVLAAAGRIDFDAMVRQVEKQCGGWERFPVGREMATVEVHSGSQVVSRPATAQQYVLQLSAAPDADDPLRFAAHLLVSLLGDSSGSRLYWQLLHPGLAEQVSTHYYEYDDAGLMMTWLCCDPERVEQNLQAINEVYCTATKDGFTSEELARAKTKINSRMVLASE
ncbi:MAG: insulinase family protein, partial [Planctomycetales bacterium]